MTDRTADERIDELLKRNGEILTELRAERMKVRFEQSGRKEFQSKVDAFDYSLKQFLASILRLPLLSGEDEYDTGDKTVTDLVSDVAQLVTELRDKTEVLS